MSTEKYQDGNFHLTSSDEIDFLSLFKQIWEGKFIILSVVFVSALVAFVVLKYSTSYYIIGTTIDVTTDDQLRSVAPSYLKVSESQIYSPDDKKKLVEYQISYPDAKKIYDRVLLQATSISVMKAFWEKRTGVTLDLRPESPKTNEVLAFRKFYQGVHLESSNPKTPEITARKISVEYADSEQGVNLLNEYINFLNEYVLLNYLKNLETAYKANLNALELNYEALNKIEQRRLNDKIIVLQENLKLAESLGIRETPFKELENIQLRVLDGKDYLLGTKPLSQQIEILTARQGKSLAPFSGELRNMEIWKDQISSDLKRLPELKGNIRLFSVVNSPESSLDPVKPKKMLIFLAVVFLAGVTGVIVVLIRSALLSGKLAD